MNRVIPWLVRWARRASKEIFVLPWMLWSAKYKIFFPYRTPLFSSFFAQQAGQADVLGRLPLSIVSVAEFYENL
jgi:hypothetical protein